MKILVFSDSHGRWKNIDEAIALHGGVCDAVIFLGDGLSDISRIKDKYPNIAFFAVRGNCDVFGFSDTPEEMCVNFDGIKIFFAHGHRYGVKGSYGHILNKTNELSADAVVFGHTHEPLATVEYFGNRRVQVFNPGSIGAGSYGIINTSNNVIITSWGTI